jgi:hypothetical protein
MGKNTNYSEDKIMFRVGDLVTWNLKENSMVDEGERGVVLSEEEGVSWKICLVRWSCGTEDWYPTKLLENLTRA